MLQLTIDTESADCVVCPSGQHQVSIIILVDGQTIIALVNRRAMTLLLGRILHDPSQEEVLDPLDNRCMVFVRKRLILDRLRQALYDPP